MKKDSIVVEFNLTSNEFILGVMNNSHPMRLFYDAGIPIVISTDDAGVSRNNLSTEYLKLASRYPFSYNQLKSFAYNSVTFSFLSSPDKQRMKKLLDRKFQSFEAGIASKMQTVLK